MRVAGCFLEYDGKLLILLRHKDKLFGETWGLPAGKVEDDETDTKAMVRELAEETGYQARPDELQRLGSFLATSGVDFIVFRIKLDQEHVVKIAPEEHTEYRWVTPEECYKLPNQIENFSDILVAFGYVKPSGQPESA